jgi:aminotransferase
MPKNRSKRLADLAQSDIRRMTRECDAVGGINLGQGICQLPTPEAVAAGAIEAIKRGDAVYSYPEGILPLREAIAGKLRRENQIEADPMSEIVVTSGASGAYTAAIHALLDPGDGILMFEPYYGYHRNAAAVAGLIPQFVSLEGPGYEVTLDALRAGIQENTRAVVVCTPANPSGKMWSVAELELLAQVARENDLIVITDEIYESITYGEAEHISPATVSDLRERSVTIMGLSKTFSITGWRLGYAVTKPEWAQAMTIVHDLFYICAPTPLQHGVTAGFSMPDSFYTEMRAQYARKREVLCEALSAAGLDPTWPQGAYYVLADMSKLGKETALEASMELLKRTGVASVPGSAFYRGDKGESSARFCFALSEDLVSRAATSLRSL